MIPAPGKLKLLNLFTVVKKRQNAQQALHFIAFPQNYLIDLEINEHSCKILYLQ